MPDLPVLQAIHPDPVRQLWACVLTLAWLALLARTVWRRHRAAQSQTQFRSTDPAPDPERNHLLIAYASQNGFAATLAQQHAEQCTAQGWHIQLLPLGDVTAPRLQAATQALFLISTTGEGDAPDNAADFIARLMTAPTHGKPSPSANLMLPRLRYRLLALGDARYANFCGFGRAVDAWLQRVGAESHGPRIELDDGHPQALQQWQQAVADFVGSPVAAPSAQPACATGVASVGTAPAPQPPALLRWRLSSRQILNSGSPGAPIGHLILEPLDRMPEWQAGDVAHLQIPPNTASASAVWRDYSIASLPGDGQLELLVRQIHRSDGSPGMGSHWLLHQAEPGQSLHLSLRRNPLFHAPPAQTPLLLIGNGTGLAGLLAHLRQRAQWQAQGIPCAATWLLYGERTRTHDAHFDAILKDWLASGVLQRLERAFSRDPGNPPVRYVQELVAQHAQDIAALVDQGAAIYVCGQRQGMAQGVQAELQKALGEHRLQQLRSAGRYRRDVY